jgi:hypothetical protein
MWKPFFQLTTSQVRRYQTTTSVSARELPIPVVLIRTATVSRINTLFAPTACRPAGISSVQSVGKVGEAKGRITRTYFYYEIFPKRNMSVYFLN